MPAVGTLTIGFPAGWFGDFHAAPKHQWMTTISGALEITVTDGEKCTFEVGMVALQMDKGSKGYSTRVVGDEACLMLVTEV